MVYSHLTVLEVLCDFDRATHDEQLDIASAVPHLDFLDAIFILHISHGLSPGAASKRHRQPSDKNPEDRLLALCKQIAYILSGVENE